MCKFSVIIPVYNMEKTLERCLMSLKNQVFTDFEAIIVDDGSFDKSREICDNFIKDSRFKYYFKENGGLVSAVSYGIRFCHSEYICFLDADDFLGDKFLYNFNLYIEKHDYDIISMGFYYYKDNSCKEFRLKENNIKGMEIINDYIFTDNLALSNNFFVARWNKAYKFELIKKISNDYKKFVGLNTGEDSIFNFFALNENPNVFICDSVNQYYYDISNDSMTRKTKDYFSFTNEIEYLNNTIVNFKSKYNCQCVNYLLNNIIFMIGMNYINGYMYKKNAYKNIKKITKNDLFHKALCYLMEKNELNFKVKLKFYMLKLRLIRMYILFYKFYNFIK